MAWSVHKQIVHISTITPPLTLTKTDLLSLKKTHVGVVRRRNKKLKEGCASESVHSEMWQQQ